MTLSIVIPAKNEEKYLPKLLKSIKKQTFKDYEIIVADNRSIDKTKEIAKKYGCRVTSGGLPGKARNQGAKVAQGEMLLFLDSDTELRNKDFLEKAIREFKRRRLDIAVPLMYLKGKKMDKLYFDFWNRLTDFFQYSLTPFAGGWCIFIKKDLHNKIKGFDERITLGEDSDYAQRAVKYKLFKIKFKVLKSVKIQVSPRRFEKEGHLKVAAQGIGTGFHWAFFGKDRKNKFGYKFDIYKEK
ncbi:MAG: glycosyltransferase [Patescibacteria group bacterium]|nr:glycosyltransferase [Patescibacteria group bacterium]